MLTSVSYIIICTYIGKIVVFSVAKDGLPRALQVLYNSLTIYIIYHHLYIHICTLIYTHILILHIRPPTSLCVLPQTLPGAITDDVSTASLPDLTTPLYLLVNENTASAAEVLAAALKENDRAVLVGHKTFGKYFPHRGTNEIFMPHSI